MGMGISCWILITNLEVVDEKGQIRLAKVEFPSSNCWTTTILYRLVLMSIVYYKILYLFGSYSIPVYIEQAPSRRPIYRRVYIWKLYFSLLCLFQSFFVWFSRFNDNRALLRLFKMRMTSMIYNVMFCGYKICIKREAYRREPTIVPILIFECKYRHEDDFWALVDQACNGKSTNVVSNSVQWFLGDSMFAWRLYIKKSWTSYIYDNVLGSFRITLFISGRMIVFFWPPPPQWTQLLQVSASRGWEFCWETTLEFLVTCLEWWTMIGWHKSQGTQSYL